MTAFIRQSDEELTGRRVNGVRIPFTLRPVGCVLLQQGDGSRIAVLRVPDGQQATVGVQGRAFHVT